MTNASESSPAGELATSERSKYMLPPPRGSIICELWNQRASIFSRGRANLRGRYALFDRKKTLRNASPAQKASFRENFRFLCCTWTTSYKSRRSLNSATPTPADGAQLIVHKISKPSIPASNPYSLG